MPYDQTTRGRPKPHTLFKFKAAPKGDFFDRLRELPAGDYRIVDPKDAANWGMVKVSQDSYGPTASVGSFRSMALLGLLVAGKAMDLILVTVDESWRG